MQYLEMKYNLMMSYCTFLAFYLLLKIDGKQVSDHPVIYRIAHIKSLQEKLAPLDEKLDDQVAKLLAQSEKMKKVSKKAKKVEI
jgi:hypothetical protein